MRKQKTMLFIGYFTAAAIAVFLRWPTMNFSLSEAFAFRQMQTTLMIREYMEGGLFQLSPLPLLGPPWQVPLEFPLFQWLAAFAGNIVGASPQIAGRLTALFFFLLSAALVAILATRLYSQLAGFIGFILFLFLPFGWQWGNAPMIEFLATAAALISVLLIIWWIERKSWWLILALSLSLTVLFLVKITTAVVWVVPIFLVALVWQNSVARWARESSRRWPLAIALGIAGVAGLAWTRFSDNYKSENQFTQFLTSDSLTFWNFGSVDQRLDTANWSAISQYGESIYGAVLIFLVVMLAAIALWPHRLITAGFAAALLVGPLVFMNLYYMHNYYLSTVYPAIVLVLAAGIAGVAKYVPTDSARFSVAGLSVFSLLAVAWISPEGQMVSQRSASGLYQFPLAAELVENTPEGAGIITVGCDWDPAYFYLSGRKGLMLSGRNADETIPVEWIGPELQYVASCIEGIDPRASTGLRQPMIAVSPNIWRIVPN